MLPINALGIGQLLKDSNKNQSHDALPLHLTRLVYDPMFSKEEEFGKFGYGKCDNRKSDIKFALL